MASKPDIRELAHEAIGSARLTAFGVSNVAPAGAVAGGLVIVAALAIGCVAALALMLGLPLTFTYGGTRAFGYLAKGAGLSVVLIYLAANVSAIRAFRTGFRDDSGSAAICSYRRRPLFSCCFPSDGPAWALSPPAYPPAGGITRARVTTFHDGPTGWSPEFRRV